MRLINADALKRIILSEGSYQNMVGVLEEEIDNAPTIDAEPIIRCKECEYFVPVAWYFDDEDEKHNCCFCTNHDIEVQDNDYCSYAERRAE